MKYYLDEFRIYQELEYFYLEATIYPWAAMYCYEVDLEAYVYKNLKDVYITRFS